MPLELSCYTLGLHPRAFTQHNVQYPEPRFIWTCRVIPPEGVMPGSDWKTLGLAWGPTMEKSQQKTHLIQGILKLTRQPTSVVITTLATHTKTWPPSRPGWRGKPAGSFFTVRFGARCFQYYHYPVLGGEMDITNITGWPHRVDAIRSTCPRVHPCVWGVFISGMSDLRTRLRPEVVAFGPTGLWRRNIAW